MLETKAIENPNYFHFYHFSQCSYRGLLNQAESHVIFLGFIANFRIFILILESPCLEESGSTDQAELDLTLSANERSFQKALDRHLATTGTPTTDSIHVASDANVGTDPVFPSSSR